MPVNRRLSRPVSSPALGSAATELDPPADQSPSIFFTTLRTIRKSLSRPNLRPRAASDISSDASKSPPVTAPAAEEPLAVKTTGNTLFSAITKRFSKQSLKGSSPDQAAVDGETPTPLQYPFPVQIPSPPSDALSPGVPATTTLPTPTQSEPTPRQSFSFPNPNRLSISINADGGIRRMDALDVANYIRPKFHFSCTKGTKSSVGPVVVTIKDGQLVVETVRKRASFGRKGEETGDVIFTKEVPLVSIKLRISNGLVLSLIKSVRKTVSRGTLKEGTRASKDQIKFQLVTAGGFLNLEGAKSEFDQLVMEVEVEKALALAGSDGGEGTKILYQLRQREENRRCRECSAELPEWVVIERFDGDGFRDGRACRNAAIVCESCAGRFRGDTSCRYTVRSFLLDEKLFANKNSPDYIAVINASNNTRMVP
ncbi:hypothetical protein HDV00_011930 [Rhizophlyctis rosea]|nr:hypothetical protein HDV00_011930 [Rhizophlyctis rosea]